MKEFNKLRAIQIILMAFIFCNLSSVSASALRGVKETRLVFEELSEDDPKCGITKGMIEAAVRLPLSNSKINVTERTVGNFLYVNVLTVELRGMCSVSVRVEFKKLISSQGEMGAFWNNQTLLVWGRNEIAMRVSNTLEGYAKEFIAEWLKANSN